MDEKLKIKYSKGKKSIFFKNIENLQFNTIFKKSFKTFDGYFDVQLLSNIYWFLSLPSITLKHKAYLNQNLHFVLFSQSSLTNISLLDVNPLERKPTYVQ